MVREIVQKYDQKSPMEFRMELFEELKKRKKSAVIAFGPPGVGKTEAILQAAEMYVEWLAGRVKRMKRIVVQTFEQVDLEKWTSTGKLKELVKENFLIKIIRLYTLQPGELKGRLVHVQVKDEKGNIVGMFSTYAIPSFVKFFIIDTGDVDDEYTRGIIVIDEITNEPRDYILAEAYQILLDKMFGEVKIPDNRVLIVATGNTPEHSSLARALPWPLLNRARIIFVKAPSVEEWSWYMGEKFGSLWATEVAAFLKKFPSMILKLPETSSGVVAAEGFTPFPTPRSWTQLAVDPYELLIGELGEKELLEKVETPEIKSKVIERLKQVACSYVGAEAGDQFRTFLNIVTRIPDPETVLEKPEEVIPKLFYDDRALELILLTALSTTSRVIAFCTYETNKDKKIEMMIKLIKVMSIISRKFADVAGYTINVIKAAKLGDILLDALNKAQSEKDISQYVREYLQRLAKTVIYRPI